MAVRLGQIYDGLDNGDYKNTLRLIRNAESRNGPDPVLLALKALALVRSDRHDEARHACRQFVESRPCEPAVLETALLTFKELNQFDWNREAYEAAVEQRSGDETLLIGLYFAHLREWSFLKQQQIAMRLFRLTGAEKYMRWAALCVELQNGCLRSEGLMITGDEIPVVDPDCCRLLQLAPMLLEKHSPPETMSCKSLHQYIRVLRRLGRHEDVVKAVHSRCESDADLQLELAQSLVAVGLFNQAALILEELLRNRNADDWRYLKLYVESRVAFNHVFEGHGPIAVLRELRRPGRRGPWLAELYTTNLMHMEPDNFIVEYFAEFGQKRAFFGDVEPYLSKIGNVENVLGRMKVGDSVGRRASYEMCWRSLRCHESCSEDGLRAKAQDLYDAYIASVDPGKEKTEFGVGDDLCLLCAFTLIDLYRRDGCKENLLQAVAVLTVGLRSSPHNFQFLLLLIRLYAELGAFIGAFEHYAALDTKSIQLETLTHLVQNDALRYGLISHAVALASAVVSHHDQYARDAPDLIVLCHMKDNLDQVVEFTQFRERMRRSLRQAESRRILEFFTNFLSRDISCSSMRMSYPPDENPTDLLSNDDFSLLLHPDKEIAAQLNRSSSFLFESSWQSGDAREPTLRFLRTALRLTDAMARADRDLIQEHLQAFRDELTEIGVVDFSAPVSAEDGFMKQHWRYCNLIFECASSLCQAWNATSSIISGDCKERDMNLGEDWAAVQRQSHLIEIMLQELIPALIGLFGGEPASGAASLATFLNFAARWSVLLIDAAAVVLPAKRAAFDKLCKKSGDRNLDREAEIWQMLYDAGHVFASLRITIQTQFETLRARVVPTQTLSFGKFSIRQMQDDEEVQNSVKDLLARSRAAICDHALDSIDRCLKSLSEVKIHKPIDVQK